MRGALPRRAALNLRLGTSKLRFHFVLPTMIPLREIRDTDHDGEHDKNHVQRHRYLLYATLHLLCATLAPMTKKSNVGRRTDIVLNP
jgi:hypothetical protein